MVAGTPFIWLLAVLTAGCGIALIVMLWRRRQQSRASDALAAELAARISQTKDLASDDVDEVRAHRIIDDYAIPIALAARVVGKGRHPSLSHGDDSSAWKICPACGSRYGHEYRTCSRDDSELAALN